MKEILPGMSDTLHMNEPQQRSKVRKGLKEVNSELKEGTSARPY